LSYPAGYTRSFITDGLRVEDADTHWLIGGTTKWKQDTTTGWRGPVSDRKSVSNDDRNSSIIVGHVTIGSQLTTKTVGLDVLASTTATEHPMSGMLARSFSTET
jgi:hypothetical protein